MAGGMASLPARAGRLGEAHTRSTITCSASPLRTRPPSAPTSTRLARGTLATRSPPAASERCPP
eukprot:6474792-Prymnesium_polylepis.1